MLWDCAVALSKMADSFAVLHPQIEACRACPKMRGTPVHGPPVQSRILLLGQAPGPREAALGRPFAWTAGRTLFSWFFLALGASEAEVRARIYFAAVARCFPGKANGGGDRKPAPEEAERCRTWLRREVALLQPRLVIPVGGLAISEVTGHGGKLVEVIGQLQRQEYLGASVDVIPLPHPSGASTWHRMEPGLTLLQRALGLLRAHPEVQRAFTPAFDRKGGA